MSHTYSKEILYHLRCNKCNQWWSIADKYIDKQYCPKCGEYQQIKEIKA